MITLANLTFGIIKAALPPVLVCSCRSLKKHYFAIEREGIQIQFLEACLANDVIPPYVRGKIIKERRKGSRSRAAYVLAINEEIAYRIGQSATCQRKFDSALSSLCLPPACLPIVISVT